MTELTDRGLDGDSLVRYGLFPELLAPVFGTLVAAQLIDDGESRFGQERSSIDLEGWRRVFGLGDTEPEAPERLSDPDQLEEAIKRVLFGALNDALSALGPVVAWVFSAEIDDVLMLKPPSSAKLEDLWSSGPTVGPELMPEYRWIIDRFSTTFYSLWATESLHMEYRWTQSLATPPCSVGLMLERPIGRSEIEPEIARRTVHEAQRDSATDRLNAQVFRHAKAFLLDGRSREAAALFEFVCREQPSNADALNNLGFCLIPESPRIALQHLEEADRLGYSPRVVNVYNRMCCHIAINHPRDALREARRYHEDSAEPNAVPATLWSLGVDGTWVLEEIQDARDQIAMLTSHAVNLDKRRRLARSDRVDEATDTGV
jgi:hypothetical protein